VIELILKLSNLVLLLLSVVWLSRTPDWEPLIAFLALFFGYAYQEFKDYKKLSSKDSSLKHDKSLFQKYNELLPENDFLYVLNNDLFNSWIQNKYSKQLGVFLELAKSIDGQFLNKEIRSVFEKFTTQLIELKFFMAAHFFVNDGSSGNSPDEWILSLYPELKHSGDDQKRQRYSQREKELHELIDLTIDTYKSYRKAVKAELHM
jgi:hypothetical protein